MKIGLVSSAVPLINGGYRFIVEWLAEQLVARGHEVEVMYIPSTDDLDQILPQMIAFRTIKLRRLFRSCDHLSAPGPLGSASEEGCLVYSPLSALLRPLGDALPRLP